MEVVMGTLAGGKMSGSHTTVIPGVERIIRAAHDRVEVTKIVLGPIESGKNHGAPRLKTLDTDTGLDCTYRSNTGVQKFRVYTSDRHATASAMHEVAPEKRGKTKKKGKPDEKMQSFIDPIAKVPIKDWVGPRFSCYR